MTHRIGIMGGDGIGPEVVAEGLKVIDALGIEYEVAAALLPVAEALVVGNGRGVDGVAGLTQLIQGAAFHAVMFFGTVSKISRNSHVFNHLQVYFGHDFSPNSSFSKGPPPPSGWGQAVLSRTQSDFGPRSPSTAKGTVASIMCAQMSGFLYQMKWL